MTDTELAKDSKCIFKESLTLLEDFKGSLQGAKKNKSMCSFSSGNWLYNFIIIPLHVSPSPRLN